MALKKKKSKNPAKNRTKKAVARKAAPKRVSALSKKAARGRGRRLPRVELAPSESETRAAGQAGGLQGLSDVPDADSESVDELLEEGPEDGSSPAVSGKVLASLKSEGRPLFAVLFPFEADALSRLPDRRARAGSVNDVGIWRCDPTGPAD